MTFLYFIVGGFVILVDLLNRKLLIRKESLRYILIISVILFLVGLALHVSVVGTRFPSGAFLCPLINLGQFWFFRKIFLRYVKREPKYTFLSSEKGLGADRLFNFLFFVFGWLAVMFTTVGMNELAKAGW